METRDQGLRNENSDEEEKNKQNEDKDDDSHKYDEDSMEKTHGSGFSTLEEEEKEIANM